MRHDKTYRFDIYGYREVSDFIEFHGYTKEMLDIIVENDDKQRYEYNEDKTKIRARQGHSISVDVDLREVTPLDVLYYGTSCKSVHSILNEGIKKMSRQYVYLSKDDLTARAVGSRHGIPQVLYIDTKKMREDGVKFWLSNNRVWLTRYVDQNIIKIVIDFYRCYDNT